MEYAEFIEVVERAGGGLGEDAAECATEATLRTLAERLPAGEARHILRELPAELKAWIYTETDAEPFDVDEFLDRVAQRTGADIETAWAGARAVFFALGAALSGQEVAHLAASLPQSFDPLMAEAQRRYVRIMPAGEIWARVAKRAGLDETGARVLTEAVFETLAERIAAGEVDDLIAQLDPLLHLPLQRGKSASTPNARRMALEEFLRRVAEREGADADEAELFEVVFGQARAVFVTLAEAVSAEEWFDVIVELPEEYRELIPARAT